MGWVATSSTLVRYRNGCMGDAYTDSLEANSLDFD